MPPPHPFCLLRVRLVESIPVGLYPSTPLSRGTIADSWLRLLEKANSSVHIAAFYFTLRDPSESQVSSVARCDAVIV